MTFVYWQGDIAVEFAEAMSERARAGVRVRLLIDALGGRLIEKTLVDQMDRAGVQVEWFRKPLMKSPFKSNHRLHRKICVVDGRIAFTGGVGIARGVVRRRAQRARVAGHPPAGRGTRRSTACSRRSSRTGPRAAGRCTTTTTSSRSSRRTAPRRCRSSAARPASAGTTCSRRSTSCSARRRERLRIATAYFAPDDDFLDTLCAAPARGVDVDLLLPGPHADKRVSQLTSEGSYARLVDCGVRVWTFQPSMMHAKVMTVDGIAAVVGSSNFNRRSLDHDEEVVLIALDRDLTGTLDAHLDDDFGRSEEIDLTRWREPVAGPAGDGDRGQADPALDVVRPGRPATTRPVARSRCGWSPGRPARRRR